MADQRLNDLGIEGLEQPVEIGVGGFATVYRAEQPAFRRTVAVKVLAALNLDDASRERFERECQAMGSLSEHPNIVTVYGAGFTDGGGRPYLVMAYLPGGSLQERIDRQGAVPWQDATLYGVHLAGALETAHRAGIIHRDIKPGNVLMSSFGDAQLTDFGIARISGGHETRSGVITASMSHAPPEILDGQRPTVAADVYSLGSTLFELISGRPAFEVEGDESMVPMLRRILTDPPPDLRPIGVPDAVCTVLERAMAKDPALRQASALQLGRELQAARRSLGLDPGKLTVPADIDVDPDQTIDFVAAPPATVQSPPLVPPSPAATTGVVAGAAAATGAPAAPAAPVAPVAPTAPAAAPFSAPATFAAPAPAPAPAATAPVAGSAGTAGTPPGGRSKGLLVGVGILVVLVLGAIGFLAVKASSNQTVASSDTTTTTAASVTTTAPGTSSTATTLSPTTDSSVTTTSEAEGYSAEMERRFVDACAENPGSTRIFCRCVFKGIKDQVPYETFLKWEELVQNGGSLKGTAYETITVDCAKRSSVGSPTSTG